MKKELAISLVVLTENQAKAIVDALNYFAAMVPDDHPWTQEERRLYERSVATLNRKQTS